MRAVPALRFVEVAMAGMSSGKVRSLGMRFGAALGLLFGCVLPLEAAAVEAPQPPYVEVTGEAEVQAAPDTALLDFGVVSRAETAAAAAQQNAAAMQAVLDAVRKALGPNAEIGTGTYSLRADYATPRDSTAPRISGYIATNVVRLRTDALGRLGELIDVATKAGANQVQRIAFTLSDPSGAQRRALREAVLDANAEAEAIAAALGAKVGSVQSVTEQDSGPVRPFMQDAMMARAAEAATPIEPGVLTLRARVLVRAHLLYVSPR